MNSGVFMLKRYSVIKVLTFSLLLAVLASCRYADHVSMDYSLHHGPCFNNDSTLTAFIVSTRAYRKPVGISRFPDGGIPQYLVEETGLYILNNSNMNVKRIEGFNDLARLIGTYRSSWKTRLAMENSSVLFYVAPLTDWQYFIKGKDLSPDDSASIEALRNKYSFPYRIDLKTGNREKIEMAEFDSLFERRNAAEFSEVNNKLEEIELDEIGLTIQAIYPKPDMQYIEETIYLKNKSAVSRRAVVEQIIGELSSDEIRELLADMEAYSSSLTGSEKREYQYRISDIRQRMEQMTE